MSGAKKRKVSPQFLITAPLPADACGFRLPDMSWRFTPIGDGHPIGRGLFELSPPTRHLYCQMFISYFSRGTSVGRPDFFYI